MVVVPSSGNRLSKQSEMSFLSNVTDTDISRKQVTSTDVYLARIVALLFTGIYVLMKCLMENWFGGELNPR